MIEAWAERMAISIKNTNEKGTVSIEVMKYALTIVINFMIPYSAAAVFGLLTGKFADTVLAIVAFILIRSASGGYHLQSSTGCMVLTFILSAAPPHLPFPSEWMVYATALSLLLAAILAPANIKGYARMPEKYFPLMKIVSLLIIGSNFIVHSPVLTIVFLLQAISLCIPNERG